MANDKTKVKKQTTEAGNETQVQTKALDTESVSLQMNKAYLQALGTVRHIQAAPDTPPDPLPEDWISSNAPRVEETAAQLVAVWLEAVSLTDNVAANQIDFTTPENETALEKISPPVSFSGSDVNNAIGSLLAYRNDWWQTHGVNMQRMTPPPPYDQQNVSDAIGSLISFVDEYWPIHSVNFGIMTGGKSVVR